ncbi:MAG: DUF3854 domain-containing protein [Cyanobacteria bacterium P01_D01_bin.36]
MLHNHHWDEIVASGVAPEIIERNWRSIDDPREIDELLNRNTNRKWQHWEYGPGWWVAGINPASGDWGKELSGGQFKPDTAPTINGSPQKYFSPVNQEKAYFGTSPLFLDCHGVTQYSWTETLESHLIPIGITEGAKKAGASMSLKQDMPVISVPGVGNAQKQERLHPDIQQFATLGRKVYLLFDSDSALNKNVCRELERLGRLLTAEGCVVYSPEWPVELKGLDDWLMSGQQMAIAA